MIGMAQVAMFGEDPTPKVRRIRHVLWHYTSPEGAAGILRDGYIRAEYLDDAKQEGPKMVWLSRNQWYEMAANVSFGEMPEPFKAHRFEYIGPKPRTMYTVVDFMTSCLLYVSGKGGAGANPDDWRVVTRDILLSQIGRHEVWTGREWLPATEANQ